MGDEEDKTRNKLQQLQYQIRQNANQTTDYLSELQQWTNDMRLKDAGLLQKSSSENTTRTPIRNAGNSETGIDASQSRNCSEICSKIQEKTEKKEKIKSSDYRAWDKFNVDEACDDVDYETAKVEDEEHCGSEYEYQENDVPNEELELAAKKKRAELEKIRGNEFFEKGKYLEASMAYTRALGFDYKNPVYFANRAMASLKLKKFVEAEKDSSAALALDPSYLKAYHRRATARLSLKNIGGAKCDFLNVLKLDPGSEEAKEKLEIIRKWEEKHGQKQDSSACGDKDLPEEVRSVKTPVVKDKTEEELEKEAILRRRGIVEVKTLKVQDGSSGSQSLKQRIPLQFLPTPAVPTSTKPLRKIEIQDASEVILAKSATHSIESNFRSPLPAPLPPSTPTPNSATVVSSVPGKETLSPQVSERSDVAESSSRTSSLLPASKPAALSWKDFSQKCFTVHKNPAACADFIQQVSPSSYARLIGQTLEPEMFSTIVNGSIELCHRGFRQDALCHLTALSAVPRFGFFVHLLTDQQKQGLLRCLDDSCGNGDKHDELTNTVAKKFSLKLKQ